MARARRKTFLWICLLALFGLGGWIFNEVYRTTGFSLERAEEFLFRRMTVTKLAEQGSYRYFFVTNRLSDSDDGPVEKRYGTSRAGTANC